MVITRERRVKKTLIFSTEDDIKIHLRVSDFNSICIREIERKRQHEPDTE